MKRRLLSPPRLPTAAMLTYRSVLRRALMRQQSVILAAVLASYTGDRSDAGAADGDVPIRLPSEVFEVVGRRISAKAGQETKRIIGITREQAGANRKQIDAWRKRNVALVKSIATEQRGQLREVLAEADAGGWHKDRLRTAIEERFEVARSRADLIARDQVLKLNSAMTQARQRAVGVTEYIWRTSGPGEERVRESHAALEGTKQSWDDPPEVDGERVHPGEAIACRCTPEPVIPWLDDEDDR